MGGSDDKVTGRAGESSGGELFLAARDQMLGYGNDPRSAPDQFRWPALETFNWAFDYFDRVARGNTAPALRVVSDRGLDQTLTFEQLARRSSQVAAFLDSQGIGPGDRVLLMLANVVPLWEIMLAAIKVGAVIVPATTLLERDELRDRIARGRVKAIVTHAHLAERFSNIEGAPIRVAVPADTSARLRASADHAKATESRSTCDGNGGWVSYARSYSAPEQFSPRRTTRAQDLLLLYFTSGTTALPKLVAHTHQSYPVGHLSTMYWLGQRPGDVHLNLSSPGWAKHAWSCLFAPWNAEACVLGLNMERFDARELLDQLVRCAVTTFCAPPTVWRLLIQQDLKRWRVVLREAASAGEPLNAEIIERVRRAWGVTIRDGYGQTETCALIGNPPGQVLKPGSMGQALPGYRIVLLDERGVAGEEGEICVELAHRPTGVMNGYQDDIERNAEAMRHGHYHTGDIAKRDAEGYFTYVGRMDDVFKSSDYRISPFELESILIEHPAVAEAAVVPSADPVRLSVPKAFVTLRADWSPEAGTARSIFQHVRKRCSPFKRVRRIEFGSLPKTISGKIRRIELRRLESEAIRNGPRREREFREEDFPEL